MSEDFFGTVDFSAAAGSLPLGFHTCRTVCQNQIASGTIAGRMKTRGRLTKHSTFIHPSWVQDPGSSWRHQPPAQVQNRHLWSHNLGPEAPTGQTAHGQLRTHFVPRISPPGNRQHTTGRSQTLSLSNQPSEHVCPPCFHPGGDQGALRPSTWKDSVSHPEDRG